MNITVSADTEAKTKAVYNQLINELGIETVTLALIDAMDTTISNIGSDGKFVSDEARTTTLKSRLSDGAGTTTLKSRLDSIKTIYGL